MTWFNKLMLNYTPEWQGSIIIDLTEKNADWYIQKIPSTITVFSPSSSSKSTFSVLIFPLHLLHYLFSQISIPILPLCIWSGSTDYTISTIGSTDYTITFIQLLELKQQHFLPIEGERIHHSVSSPAHLKNTIFVRFKKNLNCWITMQVELDAVLARVRTVPRRKCYPWSLLGHTDDKWLITLSNCAVPFGQP